MKLKIVRADPAGNITLFVLDPVEREERTAIASKLMEDPRWGAQQVAFLCAPRMGGEGRMEMAGGEFCGNAARAFGMLAAKRRGGGGRALVEVSGADRPVEVDADLAAGTAQAEMPLPVWVRDRAVDGRSGVVVNLGGIAHLVVEGERPSLEFFGKAEPLFRDIPGLNAYGVMFLDPERGELTPLVKVPAAGTLVWEGSCGSGSLAAAVAQSRGRDGAFSARYSQPAGTVTARVVRKAGAVTAAWIGGPVRLDEPADVEI